ncbi:replication protein A 70 kDa DNA-binding subunit [Bradysia coprophila]|uniref:replication protein A 70 kDa DNA-binding subunit n=1 Tax=Bradysia coprophila TaxID=38358 RepID=UPI00187DD432|nr:replication protein A 70 kDa DNA-binding subunit [Bradysia coprophila]
MVFASLSTGCLSNILTGVECGKPVLQVLGTKRLPGSGNVRYRLLVSDGKYLISYAMLATQLNSYADENQLTDNTIIRVDKHIVSVISQEKKVVVILELAILHPGTEVKVKIGDPVPLNDANMPKTSETVAPSEPAPSSKPASNGYKPSSNGLGSSNANSSLNSSVMSSHLTSPIASLTPYQNKWVIKARVTSKTNVREWKNAKGEGKLFSMDLMDESGEIRATCFKEACDKYFEMIQVDKVYYISKCQLKSANKQFTSIKNDYEMTFNSDTVVEECVGGNDNVPKVSYNLVPLSQISQMEANATVDVAGVCREVGDIFQFTAKTTGRELKKRDVTLVDRSGSSVSLTLWGQDAENFDGSGNPIVFIKGGRINEFGGGKSISLNSGTTMKLNPDISEAHQLRGWYDNDGQKQDFSSISSRNAAAGFSTDWVNFYEAKARNLGSAEKPDYFQCKAVVHLIKTNACVYKSCSKADCNKKVLDQDNGMFRCEKCSVDSSEFKYRILLQASIADWTTNRWVTIFSDQGEKLLGHSSDEVGRAFDNNKEELEEMVSKILFKGYIFKLRSKIENFGDSPRNKIQVMNVAPVNHKEYNAQLIKNIQSLTGVGKN